MSDYILQNTFFIILGLAVLVLLATVLLFLLAGKKKRSASGVYTASAAATPLPLPVFTANETTKLINGFAPFISSETTQISFAAETAQMTTQEPNYTAILNELELEWDITLVQSKEIVT
jgi:hypothetical protein